MKNRKRWIETKRIVLERDRWICQICGIRVRPRFEGAGLNDPDLATVDHIVSISRGGERYELYNLRTLCSACHRPKCKDEDLEPSVGPCTHRRGIGSGGMPIVLMYDPERETLRVRRQCPLCGKLLRPVAMPENFIATHEHQSGSHDQEESPQGRRGSHGKWEKIHRPRPHSSREDE